VTKATAGKKGIETEMTALNRTHLSNVFRLPSQSVDK